MVLVFSEPWVSYLEPPIYSTCIRLSGKLNIFSIADQVYGDQEMHSVVRNHCMDYMVSL